MRVLDDGVGVVEVETVVEMVGIDRQKRSEQGHTQQTQDLSSHGDRFCFNWHAANKGFLTAVRLDPVRIRRYRAASARSADRYRTRPASVATRPESASGTCTPTRAPVVPLVQVKASHVFRAGGRDLAMGRGLRQQRFERPGLGIDIPFRVGDQDMPQLGKFMAQLVHRAPGQPLGGDPYFRVTALQALPHRLGTEGRKQRAKNAGVLQSSERGDVQV